MDSREESHKKIFNYIEKCINEGKLNDAKLIIKRYEEIVKYDLDLYSFKAIIKMIEGNLKDAEIILAKGLILDIKNFDLLYNLAYMYECNGDYIKSSCFYKYAAIYCTDSNLKDEIKRTIEKIQDSNIIRINNKKNNNYNESNCFITIILQKLLQNVNEYYINTVKNQHLANDINNTYICKFKDKKDISDNIEEIINLYDNIYDENFKNGLIDEVFIRILDDTEKFFVEDSLDGKKVIKLERNKEEIYIGSKYSVKEESNNFLKQVNNIEKNSIIIIFGLAFGNHILALIENIDKFNKIIIVEPKIEIFNLFKRSENYNDIISSNKICIYWYKDKDLKNVLHNIYISNIKVKFVCYANYGKIFKSEFGEFCSNLKLCFNVNFELQPEGFDYKLKEFMSKEKVEMLVTGISYAAFAFYPPFIKKETVNFALPSQDLYYDYEIAKFLMNFPNVNKNLKYVIVSLCYFSFNGDLSLSKKTRGMIHRYIETIKKTHNYDNVRGIEMLHEIYKQTYSTDDYYNDVYMKDFNKSISKFDIVNQKDLAKQHSSYNIPKTVIENELILDQYLTMLEKNGIKIIVTICPASKLYNKYYSMDSRERFYKSLNKIKEKHKFQLLDYFYSEKFNENDYYDGSHLNVHGAKKFAEILQKDINW